jgi:DNA-binding transcriptional LysR family regulator
MRLDFLGLEAFLAVAERSSFHRAAAHLGITQTALSHRMKKLEDQLGIKLFTRTTRQVSLTPAGLDLLPRARGLIEEAQSILADLTAEASARQERIAIGCLPTMAIHFLPRVLADFATAHPGIAVRVFDNSASEIAERVQKGEAEFGITILSSNRWDLEIKPLIKEPYVLICRNDHPFAQARAVRWRDLETQPLVRISPQTGNRVLIDDALGSSRDRMSWRYEVQHVASAVALVEAGVGMTVVPRVAIDAFPAGSLAAVPLRSPSITRTLGAVTRRGVPLTPVAVDLLKLIELHLKRQMRPGRRS